MFTFSLFQPTKDEYGGRGVPRTLPARSHQAIRSNIRRHAHNHAR
jgi:hypothetical protein